MKKLAIIALLSSVATMASAFEVGARLGHNDVDSTNTFGVTVSKQFGSFGAEAAFDRSTVTNVNRYSLVGSYDVAKLFGSTVSLKAGGAYVDPRRGVDGYAGLVGVGISYPVTPTSKFVVDYSYQKGQARVNAYNGNVVSAGLKVTF